MTTDFRPSGFDRREVDRRAPPTQPAAEPMGWHLDKKVPLTLVFTILVQGAMVIWAIADIKKDVELLKQDTAALHIRDTQNSDSLREAMMVMREQYKSLDTKLDRLIERNVK